MRVSVVIPTCRRPALLQRALRSVAAQTYPPSEVIVVDDGPAAERQAARRAARAVGLPALRVLANARRRGASGARNSGAAASGGAVLAFLDDDDEWLPSHLCVALAHLAGAGLDLTCAGLLYRDADGRERLGKAAPQRLAPERFLFHNPGLIGSNIVIRRARYLEVGGFDESLPAAEDIDFGLRLSLHGGVRYAPLRVALVRHHRHAGPRLSTPHGAAGRAGLRRFHALHAGRMSAAQRAQFRSLAARVWGLEDFPG